MATTATTPAPLTVEEQQKAAIEAARQQAGIVPGTGVIPGVTSPTTATSGAKTTPTATQSPTAVAAPAPSMTATQAPTPATTSTSQTAPGTPSANVYSTQQSKPNATNPALNYAGADPLVMGQNYAYRKQNEDFLKANPQYANAGQYEFVTQADGSTHVVDKAGAFGPNAAVAVLPKPAAMSQAEMQAYGAMAPAGSAGASNAPATTQFQEAVRLGLVPGTGEGWTSFQSSPEMQAQVGKSLDPNYGKKMVQAYDWKGTKGPSMIPEDEWNAWREEEAKKAAAIPPWERGMGGADIGFGYGVGEDPRDVDKRSTAYDPQGNPIAGADPNNPNSQLPGSVQDYLNSQGGGGGGGGSNAFYNDQGWEGMGPTDYSDIYKLLNQVQGDTQGLGYSDFQGVGAGSYDESAGAKRARELGSQGLETIFNAPDRFANIENALKLAREQSQPGFDEDVRNVGKSASAFGRIGSGLVNRNLADLQTNRENQFSQMRQGLTIDALDKIMSDRQGMLDSALRAGGQFRGEDLDTAGFQQGLRGEARGERSAQQDYEKGRADLGFQKAGVLTDLAARRAGLSDTARADAERERAGKLAYGASQRDEARTERDWANQYSQQNISNREKQKRLEEELTQGQWGRQSDRIKLLLNAAFPYMGTADTGMNGIDVTGGDKDFWKNLFATK